MTTLALERSRYSFGGLVVGVLLLSHVACSTHRANDSKAWNKITGGGDQVTKEHLKSKVPNFFWFDYKYEPRPGKRLWLRVDDTTWVERYSDGDESRFKVIGRATVKETEGVIVQNTAEATFQVFIADRGSKQMWLRFRHVLKGDEDWMDLGEMMNVE